MAVKGLVNRWRWREDNQRKGTAPNVMVVGLERISTQQTSFWDLFLFFFSIPVFHLTSPPLHSPLNHSNICYFECSYSTVAFSAPRNAVASIDFRR
jgi:hypothetical protein